MSECNMNGDIWAGTMNGGFVPNVESVKDEYFCTGY